MNSETIDRLKYGSIQQVKGIEGQFTPLFESTLSSVIEVGGVSIDAIKPRETLAIDTANGVILVEANSSEQISIGYKSRNGFIGNELKSYKKRLNGAIQEHLLDIEIVEQSELENKSWKERITNAYEASLRAFSALLISPITQLYQVCKTARISGQGRKIAIVLTISALILGLGYVAIFASLRNQYTSLQSSQSTYVQQNEQGVGGRISSGEDNLEQGKKRAVDQQVGIFNGFNTLFSSLFDDIVGKTVDPSGRTNGSDITSFKSVVGADEKINLGSSNSFYNSGRYAGLFTSLSYFLILTILVLQGATLMISGSQSGIYEQTIDIFKRLLLAIIMVSVIVPFGLSLSIVTNNILNDGIVSMVTASRKCQEIGKSPKFTCAIEEIGTKIRDKNGKADEVQIDGWDVGGYLKNISLTFGGWLATIPIIVVLFFSILGFIIIFIQFALRYLNIFFLSVIGGLVAAFLASKQTEGYFWNWLKMFGTLLIQQPFFLLGWVIYVDFLGNALDDPTNIANMFLAIIGLFFLVTTPTTIAGRISDDISTVVGQAYQGAIANRAAVGAAGTGIGFASSVGSAVANAPRAFGDTLNSAGNFINNWGRRPVQNALSTMSGGRIPKFNGGQKSDRGWFGSNFRAGNSSNNTSSNSNLNTKLASTLSDSNLSLFQQSMVTPSGRTIDDEGKLGIEGLLQSAPIRDPDGQATGLQAYYTSKEDAMAFGHKEEDIKSIQTKMTILDTTNSRGVQKFNAMQQKEASRIGYNKQIHLTPKSDTVKVSNNLNMNRYPLKMGYQSIATNHVIDGKNRLQIIGYSAEDRENWQNKASANKDK